MPRPLLAFFDVDETLIRPKSMFSFLDRVLLQQGWSSDDRSHAVSRFSRLAETGAPREQVNAAYYKALAGLSHSWVLELGRTWFFDEVASGSFFHEPVLDELMGLRADGAAVALVSGSFEACLAPVARAVDAEHVLGSEPATADGVYTGEIAVPMIGAAKADAAQQLIEALGIDRRRVRAYGDHLSDAPLLRRAGEGVVVGSQPDMRRLAAIEGWRHLPLEKP
ncbi:HAD family hydrolase [Sanguibacter sp. Leaf3]|uniref:HAD family hydrolase n=1 Tax=Sanguibacter sp. Leaf3 TaxID=1736209 RepID=UPI0006FA3F59|nr:HAD-IB family hydrolase [Sanguibacter sp. Leaf3]KQU00380.1 hypothetical protein ASG53_06050 [Sanguibacter sp. Leaf3]